MSGPTTGKSRVTRTHSHLGRVRASCAGGADGVQEGVKGQPHDEGGAANNQHGSNHKHYYDIPPRYCGTMNRVPANGVMAR